MKHSDMKRAPSLGGWIIAAAMGLVAAVVAYVVGHFSYPQAGFVGLVIFLLAGLILGMYWGQDAASASTSDTVAPSAARTPAAADPAPIVAPAMPAAAVMAEAASDPFVAAPAALFTAPAVEDAAPTKPARVAKPKAPAKSAAAKTPAKPAAAKPAAAKPAAPRVAKAKKPDGPVRLSAPRKGKADDLKEIEGIGPALEKLCNELGFYHFDQIAGWSEADVAWVDANMKTFKGRVVRDKWVAQSKIILAEGLDAFRIRAKTNDY